METHYQTLCDKLNDVKALVKSNPPQLDQLEFVLNTISNARLYFFDNYNELSQQEIGEIVVKLNILSELYQDQRERIRVGSLKELQKQLEK